MGLPDQQTRWITCHTVVRILAALLPVAALLLAVATLLGCVVVQPVQVRPEGAPTVQSDVATTTVEGTSNETVSLRQ